VGSQDGSGGAWSDIVSFGHGTLLVPIRVMFDSISPPSPLRGALTEFTPKGSITGDLLLMQGLDGEYCYSFFITIIAGTNGRAP
jgi:hypothetical protein